MELEREWCKVEVAGDQILVTTQELVVTYETRLGHLAITTTDRSTKYFTRAYFLVHTNKAVFDSRQMSFKDISSVELEDDGVKTKAVVIRLQNHDKSAEMNIRLSVNKAHPGITIIVQFRNRSGSDISVRSIDPLVLDVDDSSRIHTGWNGTELRFFKNGYQSWDLSQALPIDKGENKSHCFSVLKNVSSQAAFVLGFVNMRRSLCTVSAYGREEDDKKLAQIVASCSFDMISVKDKGSVVSEELFCLPTHDAMSGVQTYADITADRMDAILWPNVPSGWCSWYFYFTMPDEDEVYENAQVLEERFGKRIKWIQIDDGYQKAVGDWKVNDRFRSGLKTLVAKIKRIGYKAGLWVAPFVAVEHSEIFKDRPDWFVRDKEGEPIAVDQNPLWLGNYYALDLTNPAVIEHIEQMFIELKENGFEYWKIDFLYHATTEGFRHDMNVTMGEAFRRGLDAIRRSVGDDLILGCGAPLGPSIGYVNMMRIGTDIATDWRYDWGAGVYECAINTMTRSFLHNRWWINDPDCLLVRQDDNDLTLDEILLWATVIALSGGALLLSDRIMDVSEERLQIIDKLLPPFSKSAIAVDALDYAEPRIFSLPIETPLGKWSVTGFINLSEKYTDISIDLALLGLDDNIPHHVFDFWNEEYQGMFEKTVQIDRVKPHTCRLMVIRPESEQPDILSTSMHFTQGAVELKEKEWNHLSGELSVVVNRSTRKEEAVFFVFNGEWMPEKAYVDDNQVSIENVAPEVIAVRRLFKRGQTITIKFTR